MKTNLRNRFQNATHTAANPPPPRTYNRDTLKRNLLLARIAQWLERST